MAVIAVACAKSAGASTAALALALSWPRPSLLLEADPEGSDLHTGYLRNRGRLDLGLLGAVMSVRRRPTGQSVLDQAVSLDEVGHRLLVAGTTDPLHAATVAEQWSELLLALRDLPGAGCWHDVLVDAGRLGHRFAPQAVLEDADALVLVTRPEPAQVHRVLCYAPALAQADPARPAARVMVAVGESRDLPGRVLGQLAAEKNIAFAGTLPWDRRTAAVLAGRGGSERGLDRSILLRAARALGEKLAAAAATRPGPPLAPSPAPPGRGGRALVPNTLWQPDVPEVGHAG